MKQKHAQKIVPKNDKFTVNKKSKSALTVWADGPLRHAKSLTIFQGKQCQEYVSASGNIKGIVGTEMDEFFQLIQNPNSSKSLILLASHGPLKVCKTSSS